jgi:hypothetical protein
VMRRSPADSAKKAGPTTIGEYLALVREDKRATLQAHRLARLFPAANWPRQRCHRIAGAGVPSDQCVTGTISTLIASGES